MHELLAKVLKAQITDSETFQPLVAEVYQQARGPQATEVIVLADGAHWIWNLLEDLLPHTVQILDFSHAKHYLWEAAKLIYGTDSPFVRPWGKEREAWLFADKVEQVITHLQRFMDLAPGLAPIIQYFQQNQAQMRYGPYQQRGYFISAGAIESAGKPRLPGSRDQACAGMSPISMRFSPYAVFFWNTPGLSIGMRKLSSPPNNQKFDIHPAED